MNHRIKLETGRTLTQVVAIAALLAAVAIPAARVESEAPGVASGTVLVIPIHGEIDGVSAITTRRRVDEVLAGPKPDYVILDLDTWGGELHAAFEIAEQVDRLEAAGVKTVAYVSKKAISAGALISLAARRVAMREGTLLGDCEPILMTGEGIETGPEKIQTVLRERFESYARRNGYPLALARAMVTKGPAVYRVRSEKGEGEPAEVRFLDEAEKDALTGGFEGKHQVEEPPVVRKDQLLTMEAAKAKEYGFAAWVVKDLAQLVSSLETEAGRALTLRTVDVTWWEAFVKLVNSGEVKTVLMMIGVLGILMELKAPGMLIPGAIGVGCLTLAFFGSYLAGLANVIEVALVLVGVGLLAVEIFVLPGFGVAGVAGLLCIGVGLVLSLQSFTLPETQWQFDAFTANLKSLAIAVGCAGVLFAILLRVLPETRLTSRLVLTAEQRPEDGYTVASSSRVALLGKVGVALTTLRPAGRVEIDGEPIDAVAEGELVEKGERVEVIETDENRVVVRRAARG
jgi:membrane-bound serine protease (ClpP class)